MSSPAPEIFTPPTAEQLSEHLDRHPPRAPTPWAVWGPMVVVVVVALFGLALGGPFAFALPWLAVMGLLVFLAVRVRTGRELEAQASETQELAMLRQFPAALRRAWRLLPRLDTNPLLHARIVALMAHCLDQVKQFDAAIVGYDYLLDNLPGDNPGAAQLRVQRAIAALLSDRLSDADDSLRRLRGGIDRYSGTAVSAGYRLAQLVQQVRTNHFADAVAESGDVLEALRPLGVEAGYGHALVALSYQHAPGEDPRAAHRASQQWWQRATLLLPEETLVDRFPELLPLSMNAGLEAERG